MLDTTSALTGASNISSGVGSYSAQQLPSALNMATNTATALPSLSYGDVGAISGGSGLSSVGAGVGALAGGPVGAMVGAGVGSLADIALGMLSDADKRKEERALRKAQELRAHKDRLYQQNQDRIVNEQNATTHAINTEMGNINLETAKMSLAEQKHQKMVALVKSFQGNKARRIDPLTGSAY